MSAWVGCGDAFLQVEDVDLLDGGANLERIGKGARALRNQLVVQRLQRRGGELTGDIPFRRGAQAVAVEQCGDGVGVRLLGGGELDVRSLPRPDLCVGQEVDVFVRGVVAYPVSRDGEIGAMVTVIVENGWPAKPRCCASYPAQSQMSCLFSTYMVTAAARKMVGRLPTNWRERFDDHIFRAAESELGGVYPPETRLDTGVAIYPAGQSLTLEMECDLVAWFVTQLGL